MGDTSDNMAVVDSQTRVIGLDNIRVIDSSIMPSVVSGQTAFTLFNFNTLHIILTY